MPLISREDLVGTVFNGNLFIRFLGEGAEGVVYSVASPDDPAPVDTGTYVKMSKNQRCFEMSVLHYTYKVHEGLYPHHPHAMPPEQRLALLREEMLGKIKAKAISRRAFCDVYDHWFPAVASSFGDAFQKGMISSDFLNGHQGLLCCIDPILIERLEETIETDQIVDTWVPFAKYLLANIQNIYAGQTQIERDNALAANPLANLVGLYSMDFINSDELADIACCGEIDALISKENLDGFFQLALTLSHRAEHNCKTVLAKSKDDWDLFHTIPESGAIPAEHLQSMLSKMKDFVAFKSMKRSMAVANASATLLEVFGGSKNDRRACGRGKYVQALHALWMADGSSRATTLLESALDDLQDTNVREDRLNVLRLLANVIDHTEPTRAARYRAEAESLRA